MIRQGLLKTLRHIRGMGATRPPNLEDIKCPVCGYYCLGKGGRDCIDKPTLVYGPEELEDLEGVTYRRIYFVENKHMDIRISWNAYERKHPDPLNCITIGWVLINPDGSIRRIES